MYDHTKHDPVKGIVKNHLGAALFGRAGFDKDFNHHFRIPKYSTQGPTSFLYCLAITRDICAI